MDRLPFEVQDRLENDAPSIEADHHVSAVTIVMASKKSGTFRPFARFNPIDLMLYQALVDRLAPTIESTLHRRDQVMAYRQTLDGTAEIHSPTRRLSSTTPNGSTPSLTRRYLPRRASIPSPERRLLLGVATC